MSNIEKVFAFIKTEPGHSQREISSILKITPEQQINTIVQKMIKQGLVKRERSSGVYRYYPVSQDIKNVPITEKGRKTDNVTSETIELSAGDSKE